MGLRISFWKDDQARQTRTNYSRYTRCFTIGTKMLQLAVLLFAILAPPSLAQFCSTRLPVDCCPGRDDQCTVPYRDTVCYCDKFCDTTSGDCCPDFISHCFGGEELKKPTLPPNGGCNFTGQEFPEDRPTKVNCQTCTCRRDSSGGHEMICSNEACLMRPDLNERINQGTYGWSANIYSFLWGLTLHEGIMYRLGTHEPTDVVANMNPVKMIYDTPLPVSFDARDKWPGLISTVVDQGNCASSWAFSTAAVATDRHAIQSNSRTRNLSPQNLLSCNTNGQQGCNGGHLDKAWWYMRKYGIVTDSCYPYESGESKQPQICSLEDDAAGPCPKDGSSSRKYKTTPPYRISSKQDDIRAEIMQNGPVQASFEVREDFYAYQDGVYKYSNAEPRYSNSPDSGATGWHSVRIIGWGTDYSRPNPTDYWLCANSWGTNWGEDGYFRILRGSNEGQIESFVLGVWANLD